MKKRMGILMCFLAVMGILSVNVLPAQAAGCEHKNFLLDTGGCKYEYHDETGHYEMRCARWVCPVCDYYYWDETWGSYPVKVGDHEFNGFGICETCGYKK